MNRSRKKPLCLSMFVVLALLVSLAGCSSPGGASSNGENSSVPKNSVSASASTPPVANTADPSAGGDEVSAQTPESGEAESGNPIVPSGDEAGNTIPITVTIGDTVYAATLENNETVQTLTEQFPLTLDMSELNGNEKYFYLDGSLPTDSHQPGQIHAGDLMLYGDNCLVLFYESFSSGYSYTALGRLDDPTGLAEAVGSGGVTVTFDLAG